MELKLLKCDWGMEKYGEMPERLKKYKEAGYDGIECANTGMDPQEFADITGELGLDYVAMMFCDDEDAFRRQLDEIKTRSPILINCHPGRDYFEFERGCEFFRNVMEMAKDVDCEVVYETHRTRCLYSPWATAKYLDAIPELHICGDFSHFTTVSEGDMDTIPVYREMMDKAIARTHHIHGRIGHSQGAQVPDPRTDICMRWTELYEGWWDRVIEHCRDEGREFVTFNAEFGPPTYQPFHPETGEPLADIWEVCYWVTDRLRKRWEGKL